MLSRSEAKRIRRLHRRKHREAEGLFLAEGVRVVEDLLNSPVVPRLAVASPRLEDTPRGRALAEALEARCPLRRTDDATLGSLAGTDTPQGVLVVAETPGQDLAALRVEGGATVLILDGVQDPGNFGTLTRTAEAFGVRAVAALPGTVDPWNPKSVRAAAGSSFRVPVVQPTLGDLTEWLNRHGFTVYAAEADGEPVDATPLADRSALVVGNEGAGLSPGVRRTVERSLAVPIRGAAESLNVAVAAGILLFFLTRRD